MLFRSVSQSRYEGVDDLMELVDEMETLFIAEFAGVEDNISLKAEVQNLPSGLLPEEIQDDLINAVVSAFNGVYRFIPELPTVVETSNNIAIIKSDGSAVEIKCLMRSSVDSRKEELASMIESNFALAGAKVVVTGGYPGWKPNLDSPILKTMTSVYESKYGKTPKIMIIHAGLVS